jgi:hypothetical protein
MKAHKFQYLRADRVKMLCYVFKEPLPPAKTAESLQDGKATYTAHIILKPQ